MAKLTNLFLCPVKTLISLHINPIRSVFAVSSMGSLAFIL